MSDFLFNLIIMSINRHNLISSLNASSSNYNYAPVTDASRWKMIMKLLRFIIILMIHGSDAECSDLYHQRTRFWCSTCCSAFEHRKHPNLMHTRRVLGPLSSTNTIPMISDARIRNNSLIFIQAVIWLSVHSCWMVLYNYCMSCMVVILLKWAK